MDFHNEREVEQALRIVEEYKAQPLPKEGASVITIHHDELKDEADIEVERIIQSIESSKKTLIPLGGGGGRLLLLDGAMGTMIQQYHLREEDFRGTRFAQHPIDLKGCNDVLSLTKPEVICDIHRKYLEAGADIIETNTFNGQRISMGDYGMQDHCRDINLAAVRLARQCADEFSSSDKPRYVVGSIGPTSKTFLSEEGIGKREEFATALHTAYAEQIQALADGGVDALLIETIFDVENARIAFKEARRIAPQLPIMLSFSVSTPDGHNMLGQDICEFLDSLLSDFSLQPSDIFSVGINCVANIPQMTPLVCRLAQFGTRVSLYPNAGIPDGNGRYNKTPESLLADVWPLLENHNLNIIGGCCGTTDAHIRLFAKAIEPVPGIRLSPLNIVENGELRTERYDMSQDTKVVDDNSQQGNQTSQFSVLSSQLKMTPTERLFQAILAGKSDEATAATKDAIAQGLAPQDLINGQMIRAMGEVGQRFQDGKAFVPQLLMAGRAMKAALEQLKPMMAGATSTSLGKVVIGTVKGDLHDIGKNLVASMLEGCGFEVVNIGIDVSADKFIEAIKENQPDILCMSALLTTTMGYMKEVIDALEKAGIRNQVKVMVGGAPVTQGFADEIGADGYSDNANSAVTVAKQLLKVKVKSEE